MWVVHSVEPDRFPDGDLRGALIRHCRAAAAIPAPSDGLMEACESQFERDVLQKILTRGYHKVSVQHSVGRYRIDIVVEGPHARLAVECDGDRWHGPDVWHQDRARQQVLERANWTFERVRGSAFYRDPDVALLPLWDRLTKLGIPTGDWWSSEAPQPVLREVSGPRQPPDLTRAEGLREIRPVPEEAAQLPADRRTEVSAREGFGGTAGRFEHAIDLADIDRHEQWDGTSAPASQPSTPALLPYQAWTPRQLPHPDTASQRDIVAGLLEIVAAEGPIHAHRAFRLYTQAAGGSRVGPEMRRTFIRATRQAVFSGVLCQLDEPLPDDEKTIYMPGQPSVLMRETGPRQLTDVPRSEVRLLVTRHNLEFAAPDLIKRAVLNIYGFVRLTARASQYLDECLNLGT
jgi:very-short-patch-repair endonuclease